ncbi:MAG: 16S rRNA (adenine(1518)-N(6)/adenine(1519)-N(6))-dimethyltransferase RsmA [Melioribacter sp.]|nr:16S rRNA (adenine(1518)-N(6)/adenine(1519)-N(6))-dimethyltransferase RsmA [Melioribacter sp.]
MESKIKPLKRYGQNYLIDKNIIQKIIEEFNPSENDIILEIGPGRGALTSYLVNKAKKLITVEIDKRVVEYLKENFPTVEVINKDFLEVDLKDFCDKINKLRIIGNIPYNITSPILFKLIEQRSYIEDALLMVQYEVAKRITAKEKTKEYGILSVLLNFFAETKFCFRISPNVFYPKPKVFSAIVKLEFRNNIEKDFDDKLFINIVKAAFGNRRKILKNSFSNSIFRSLNFDSLSYLLSKRAEDLSIQNFLEIYSVIKRQL